MTFAAALAAILIGATAAPAPQGNANPKPTTVTHDGCIVASPTMKNAFTLDDEGQTYVLKGLDMRDLVGKRVQVIGAASKRLRIVGGLYPSPNGVAERTNVTIRAASRRIQREERARAVRYLPGKREVRVGCLSAEWVTHVAFTHSAPALP
jgi:hypothetical protein